MKINTLEDFIKNMPKNLNTNIEKARYLYLELGKRSFFDSEARYMFWTLEGVNLDHVEYRNPNIVICSALNRQYANLLKMIKISCEIQRDEGPFETFHDSLVFYDENGVEHGTDFSYDLKNIQAGCKTTYFGRKTIDEDLLREIDISLGYISRDVGYVDEHWYLVRDAISTDKMKLQDKIRILLSALEKCVNLRKCGVHESAVLHEKFFKYCLGTMHNVEFYDMKKGTLFPENGFIVTENEKKIKYILDRDSKKFVEEKQIKIEGDSR